MAKEGKIRLQIWSTDLEQQLLLLEHFLKFNTGLWPSAILTAGMIVEALVFTWSAFEKQSDDLDWTLAYPELSGGSATPKAAKQAAKLEDAEGILTKKLDSLLKEAKIDGALVTSLGESIRDLNSAATGMGGSMGASQKYSDEMAKAAGSNGID